MNSYAKEPDFLRLKRETNASELRVAYIFSGSEDFLTEEAVREVQQCLKQRFGTVDISRVDGAAYPLEEVLNMVDTVSLFGAARFVVITDAPYFAKGAAVKDDLDRLLSYHGRGDCEACLVICARDFTKTSKAARELAAAGVVYNFEPLKPAALNNWVRGKIAAAGLRAERAAVDLLIERVGRDLRRLASEVDKLATYLGTERELDENSVLLATSRSIQGDIFALTEAVVFGHSAKALFLLKDLLAAGEPPLRILAMLVRQFRLLGQARDLMLDGCRADELSARLGIHPYAAEKLGKQATSTDDGKLYRAVDLLLQADLDIKRGKIDQVLALETLMVALGEKTA